jgi:cell division protein FtsQ
MDDRGRLAQSLTPTEQWTPVPFSRWRRGARRIIASLIELNPPRGVGSFTVMAFMAASAGYGIVKGGHAPELTAQLHEICNSAANAAGFRITSIAMTGPSHLQRDEMLAMAGVDRDSSLLCLDAGATRARYMDNPWIAEATIHKLYPGRLQIDIKERKAIALWQMNGTVNVIAADGKVLEPFTAPRFAELPLVVGDGADHEANEIIALLARYPVIRNEVKASVLVAKRRWNLYLKNGVDVRLPENEPDAALRLLTDLDRDKKLLSRDITMVDLRLPDRVIVRLSDEAAQARTETIKLRDKKPKGKGSNA